MRAEHAALRDPKTWAGQSAALYCRISKITDEDQTGVERQEEILREIAARLGLLVPPELVFKDPNRSAWKRDRKRPGWDSLLETLRAGEVRHVLAYHPDRMMRQPKDLEELLDESEDHHVTLHGQAGGRDLSDPDDRFILRIEVAHACRSSDDTSRRIKSKMEERAADGMPHTGLRRYGYDATGQKVIEHEAEIIRAIFDYFLDGYSTSEIAAALRQARELTANGKQFEANTLLSLLRSPHVAGLRVFRGEVIGPGTWPAIVDTGTFYEVQEKLNFRAAQWNAKCTRRPYLLRGLVICARCKRHMNGAPGNHNPGYQCRKDRRPTDANNKPIACARRFAAAELEAFVKDAVLAKLETLDLSGLPAAEAFSAEDAAAAEQDRARLAELETLWIRRKITTAQYERMSDELKAEAAKRQSKHTVRPAKSILRGMVGPGARAAWEKLEQAGDVDRINAIFRFLIDSIVIRP
jgi:DNA invertase Pin-like site-specific DNA recombinase